MELVASGFEWRLSKNSEPYYYLLELITPYGTIETKLKGVHERGLGFEILRVFEDLKAQVPIEVESQVEA